MNAIMQIEIAASFAKARALIDELGEGHPKAMAAMIEAVNLADPQFMDRALAECGITLPEPTHCDEDGKPLIESVALAISLGVPHSQMIKQIDRMVADGDLVLSASSHPIQ